jgi:carbamoyltransferase
MALAALGEPARFRSLFARAIPITPAGFALDPALSPVRVLRHGWPRVTPAFIAATCPPRLPGEEAAQVHADLAAGLQERTEQVMVHLARRARAVTGAGKLCVGGGVAMNCVGIGKILADGRFDEVFLPLAIPAPPSAPRSPPTTTSPASSPVARCARATSARPIRTSHRPRRLSLGCRHGNRPTRPGTWRLSWPRGRSLGCSRAGWRPGRGRWATGPSSRPRSCQT